ncbi:UNVERIFIED_CONTAM: hypothetical protein FKN15_029145 [Acipenser sinensis]
MRNIGVINSTVFSSENLNSVSSLTIANSGATEIQPGAFRPFSQLAKLSLYQNHLTDVNTLWLSNPQLLENLTMFANNVQRIELHTLSRFCNLVALNLARNKIKTIADGSFKGLGKLSVLDLAGNELSYASRDTFSGLASTKMKLGGNPWDCSCELKSFAIFLKDLINASLLQDPMDVTCINPPTLEGSPVWNISGFHCPSPSPPEPPKETFIHVGVPILLVFLVVLLSVLLLVTLLYKRKQEKKQVKPEEEREKDKHQAMSNTEEQSKNLQRGNMLLVKPGAGRQKWLSMHVCILMVLLSGPVQLCPTNCKFCSTGLADCTQVSSLQEGGFVLAFFICVVSCVIRKHWKQRGVTNPVNPSKESDLVKYFETEFSHPIEIPPKDPSTAKHKPYLHDAGNISAEIQRTTNNAPNLKGDGVMKNPSSKRSKTWNNLHFGNQGLSFEEDGNRITRCNIELNNFSESKNDKPYNKQGGTGKGLHLLKDYETSIDSLSSKTDNTLQYGDLGYSNEAFEDMMWHHITGQPDGSDGEGNLCRSWVENEKGSLEIKEVPTCAEGRCAMPLPSQDKDAESTSHQHNGFKIKNSISLPVMQGSTNQGQWRLEPTHRDSSQMFYFGVPKLVNVQPAFNANPIPVPSLHKLAGIEEHKAERVVCIQPCNETDCLPAMQMLHEEQEETRNTVSVLSEAALTDKHDAHITNTSSQIQSKMKLEGESFIKSVDNLSSNIKDPQSYKCKEAFMGDSESVHENDLNLSPRLHGFQGRSSSLDDMRHSEAISKETAVLQNKPWYQNALLENNVGIQIHGGVSKAEMVLKSPDVFLENKLVENNKKEGVPQNKEDVFPTEKSECDNETTTTEKCIDPNELKKDDIEIHQRSTHEDLFSTMVMEENDQEVDEATPTMDYLYFSGKPTASFNMEMIEKSGRTSSPNAEEKVTHKINGVPVGNIFDLSNSNLQKSALKYKLQDATDSMQCHTTIGTLDDMHCFASDQQQKNREGFFKSNDESNKDHNGCLREWRIKNKEAKESHEFSSHFAHDTADAAQIQLEESIAPVQTKPMKKSYMSVFKLPIAMARVSQSSQKNGPMETGAGKSLDLDGISPVDCDKSKINSILTSLPPDAAGENDNAQTRQISGSFKNASGLAIHHEKFHKYRVKSKFSDTVETLLPEVDEISALNNLHYEKIRGKRIHNIVVQEHRPTALIHDEDIDTSSSSPSPARYAQHTPPKRGELLEDDELAVINVLCQLNKSLKGQAHIQL